MSIATTPARREISINPKAAAIVREWSMIEALKRIEAKQQTLTEMVERMSAVLDDVTELLTRPQFAQMPEDAVAPTEPAAVADEPEAEPHPEPVADRSKGWVNPAIRGMRSATVVQSAARRVAGMAIAGRYDPVILSAMYVQSKDATPATDDQIAEMVKRAPDEWQELGLLADKLTVRNGWSASAIGAFLALLAWRDVVSDDATVALVGRLVRPVNGEKATRDVLEREFARALDILGTGPEQVRDALRFWAGDFDWAHPDVRGVL